MANEILELTSHYLDKAITFFETPCSRQIGGSFEAFQIIEIIELPVSYFTLFCKLHHKNIHKCVHTYTHTHTCTYLSRGAWHHFLLRRTRLSISYRFDPCLWAFICIFLLMFVNLFFYLHVLILSRGKEQKGDSHHVVKQ